MIENFTDADIADETKFKLKEDKEEEEKAKLPRIFSFLQSPDTDADVQFFAGDWSEVHKILPDLQTEDKYSNCTSGSSASYGYSIYTLPALYELTKKVTNGFIFILIFSL
ncbi:hypothetical protein Tco_0348271 [Tanacetum coccineum]